MYNPPHGKTKKKREKNKQEVILHLPTIIDGIEGTGLGESGISGRGGGGSFYPEMHPQFYQWRDLLS